MMSDEKTFEDALQDYDNEAESSQECPNTYDMVDANAILASRAQRLARPRISAEELAEVTYLFFECVGQKFAIVPSASFGFIPNASLYAVPTLISRGISLVICNGQQLPIFDLDTVRRHEPSACASLLILGREAAEFGLVVEGEVILESVLSQSFMECRLDEGLPLMSNVIAINGGGRMLLDSDALMESSHFNLVID